MRPSSFEEWLSELAPNPALERTAHQRCWWVPFALRATAAAQLSRWASGAAVLCKRTHGGSGERATLLPAWAGDALLGNLFRGASDAQRPALPRRLTELCSHDRMAT